MQLYHGKRLSLPDLIAKYTVNPARLLNLPKGTLAVGADADVTLIDPKSRMGFRARRNREQIGQQPVLRLETQGRAVATIVGGKKVWTEKAEAVAA